MNVYDLTLTMSNNATQHIALEEFQFQEFQKALHDPTNRFFEYQYGDNLFLTINLDRVISFRKKVFTGKEQEHND